ncbi:MAG: hypothetical protein AAF570_15255, partial [Bacteroidota bacterium]
MRPPILRPMLCLALLLFVGARCDLAATTPIEFDFTGIDVREARIFDSNGFDATFLTKTVKQYQLEEETSYTLELSPNAGVSARLRITISEAGQIQNVRWQDGDGSQTGGNFVPLEATYYSTPGENQLLLNAAPLEMNISDSGQAQLDWEQLRAFSFNSKSPNQPFSLFPGDYTCFLGEGNPAGHTCEFALEVLHSNGKWSSEMDWRARETDNWQALPAAWFDLLAGDSRLVLAGTQLTLTAQIDVENSQIVSTNQALAAGSFQYFP